MNPLKKFLKDKDISTRDVAIMAGISEPAVFHVFTGRMKKIPASILGVLGKIGCDTEKIQNEYIEWRKEQGENLLKKLEAK